jgi:hypothetical protein
LLRLQKFQTGSGVHGMSHPFNIVLMLQQGTDAFHYHVVIVCNENLYSHYVNVIDVSIYGYNQEINHLDQDPLLKMISYIKNY